MLITANPKTLREAANHLMLDPVLFPIITEVGLAQIRPHKQYYWELIDSIISQQLSVKAAATIENRFKSLFPSKNPSPEELLNKPIEELRGAGLSGAKVTYIRDLASHILEGKVDFTTFESLSNEEIISELTAIKGIGEWTAHMFLMFCMGRLDILAIGDLGIRNGIKKLYKLENVPSPAEVTKIASSQHWSPYETVACWYIWHSLDNTPVLAST